MPVSDDTYGYRRNLPHLQRCGRSYFITFRARAHRIFLPPERDIVMETILADHLHAYWLYCAVVMPDHVHLICMPFEGWLLAKIMNRVKNVSAHRINACAGNSGPVWQREYFDRIIRRGEDVRKKGEYVCANPVRAGLTGCEEDYPWTWRSWEQ